MRLVAAFMVFTTHANAVLFHQETSFFLTQGRQAVAVFFVLSGFVIAFVVSAREADWYGYVIARASRLYSVALLAIAVTALADTIGTWIDPAYYAGLNDRIHFYEPITLWTGLISATFTNQLWFSHTIFGTNEPYWSLGFEAWYYVLFGLDAFVPKRWALAATIVWLAICGPKIALYLPLWWLGVWAYRHVSSTGTAMPGILAALLFCASIAAYPTIVILDDPFVTSMFDPHDPAHEGQNVVFYMSIGLITAVHIVSFTALFGTRTVFPPFVAKWIRWAAGGSFTLYLVHQPLLFLMSALIPDARLSLPLGLFGCLIVLVGAYGLAELGERRKHLFAEALRVVLARARRQL